MEIASCTEEPSEPVRSPKTAYKGLGLRVQGLGCLKRPCQILKSLQGLVGKQGNVAHRGAMGIIQ